jgi:hypothetical protein
MMLALAAEVKPAPAKQECSKCKHIGRCRSRKAFGGKTLSDKNDTINILVCRLKLSINVNETTRTLLDIFKYGVLNLITHTKKRADDQDINYNDMHMEINAYIIECIMTKYSLGELNPITSFLFDFKTGFLPKWCIWYVNRTVKWHERHQHIDNIKSDTEDENTEESNVDDSEAHYLYKKPQEEEHVNFEDPFATSIVDDSLKIIEDGLTLNMNEYRVMRFALQNANDSNEVRMIDGIHIHQAMRMRVSRPRATRLFKRAREKLRILYLGQNCELDEVDDLINSIRFHEVGLIDG